MQYTLLQLTQEIMSSLDSDEVNSINDTSESLQVARIIRQAYFDLVEDSKTPKHYTVFELNASGDATKPTLMTIPSDINKIEWIKYNIITSTETAPNYVEIQFLPKGTFFEQMYAMSTDESYIDTFDISTVDSSTVAVMYRNDKAPQYYTNLDNYNIIFDSYDATVDTTLQKSKTVCYGRKSITFDLSDSTTPDLDDSLYPRLLNDAKELAFAELKSVSHAIANRNSKRARSRSLYDKYRTEKESDFDQLPYFGRR